MPVVSPGTPTLTVPSGPVTSAGGFNLEAIRYAGQDVRALGIYVAAIDGLLSAPPVRGRNLSLPYQPGQRWVTKTYDERVIVLVGELLSVASRADFHAKVDAFKSLFPIGAGEQKLEIQRQDGSFRYIMAEIRNTMGLQWTTWPPKSTAFSVEMVASDPLWYGSALEASSPRLAWALDAGVMLDDGAHWVDQTSQNFAQTLSITPALVEASNAGDYFTRRPIFQFTGAMVNPKITNLRNGFAIQVNASVLGGQQLVIDCGAQSVTIAGQPQSPALVVLGPGQTDWMRLEAGENTLKIDLGVPSPVVAYQATYSPTFL